MNDKIQDGKRNIEEAFRTVVYLTPREEPETHVVWCIHVAGN